MPLQKELLDNLVRDLCSVECRSKSKTRELIKKFIDEIYDDIRDTIPYYSSDGDTEWADGYNKYRDEVLDTIKNKKI